MEWLNFHIFSHVTEPQSANMIELDKAEIIIRDSELEADPEVDEMWDISSESELVFIFIRKLYFPGTGECNLLLSFF